MKRQVSRKRRGEENTLPRQSSLHTLTHTHTYIHIHTHTHSVVDSHSSNSISAPVATRSLLSQTRTHLNLIPRQAQAHEPEATQACLAKHAYVSIKTGEQPFGMFLYMGRGEALLLRESAAMSALEAQPAAEEAFLKKKKALPCRETNSSPRCRSRRRREDIYLRAVLPKPVRRLPRRTKYLCPPLSTLT